MKPLSFFKLPLIFALIYAVINISWTVVSLFSQKYDPIIPYLFTGLLLSDMLPLLLFFLIAIFRCNKYRLHTLDTKNLFTIAIIAIVFSVLSNVFIYTYHFSLQPIREALQESDLSWLMDYASAIIISGIQTILLLLLFKFVEKRNVMHEETYEAFSSKHIYASVYSLMLLTLSSLPLSAKAVDLMLTIYAFTFFSDESILLYLVPLSIFFVLLFSYFFVYFVARNCFSSLPTSLKIMPLVKSIISTILFMFIYLIIAGIILGLIGGSIFKQHFNYMDYYSYSIPPGFTLFGIIALIVNYCALYLSIRIGIKIFFGEKDANTLESQHSQNTESSNVDTL